MKSILPLILFVSLLASLANEINAQDIEDYRWEICLEDFEDSYFLFSNDTIYLDATTYTDAISEYSFQGDTLLWIDIEEAGGCDVDIIGKYLFDIEVDTMTLELIEDSCDERAEVLRGLKLKREGIVSNDRLVQEELKIFPNPIEDQLNITGIGDTVCEFKIYNQIGQLIKSGLIREEELIDTGSLQSGSYFIQITNKSGSINTMSRLLKL